MDIKDKIEIARNLLNNAIEMNVKREIIFRLSQKIDRYIATYYQEYGRLRVDVEKEEDQ